MTTDLTIRECHNDSVPTNGGILLFSCPCIQLPSYIAQTKFSNSYTVEFSHNVIIEKSDSLHPDIPPDQTRTITRVMGTIISTDYKFLFQHISEPWQPEPFDSYYESKSIEPFNKPETPAFQELSDGSYLLNWSPVSSQITQLFDPVLYSFIFRKFPDCSTCLPLDLVEGTIKLNTQFMQVISYCPQNTDSYINTCFNNISQLPWISRIYQSSLSGENLSEALFEVYDTISYKDCGESIHQRNKIIKTVFNRHPDFNIVIDAQGSNLDEKIRYLRAKYCSKLNHYIFRDRLTEYGMLKYILGKLIYGNFSLKYLTRSFNEKFKRKLGKTRFRKFLPELEILEEYNKYFVEILC